MLKKEDYDILSVLGEHGGFTTGQIANKVTVYSHSNGHIRSAWIRLDLLHMQKEGLVEHLDNQKPVCWRLTAKGTEALRTRES